MLGCRRPLPKLNVDGSSPFTRFHPNRVERRTSGVPRIGSGLRLSLHVSNPASNAETRSQSPCPTSQTTAPHSRPRPSRGATTPIPGWMVVAYPWVAPAPLQDHEASGSAARCLHLVSSRGDDSLWPILQRDVPDQSPAVFTRTQLWPGGPTPSSGRVVPPGMTPASTPRSTRRTSASCSPHGATPAKRLPAEQLSPGPNFLIAGEILE